MRRVLFLLLIACKKEEVAPPIVIEKRECVPLVALYGDGVAYGRAADGRIFGGADLCDRVKKVDGAIAATGSTVSVFPEDSYECMLFPLGEVRCRGAAAMLAPLAPTTCHSVDNPDNPDARYQCILDWTRVPTLQGAVSIYQSCSVDAAGHVRCVGNQSIGDLPPVRQLSGQLALLTDGRLVHRANAAPFAKAPSNAVTFMQGSTVYCVITDQAELFCGGGNSGGEVGDGTFLYRKDPVKIGDGFRDVVSLAGPSYSSRVCASKLDGAVWCWGYWEGANVRETGCTSCVTEPTAIGLNDVVQLTRLDYFFVYALLHDGRVVRVENPLSPSMNIRVVHSLSNDGLNDQ